MSELLSKENQDLIRQTLGWESELRNRRDAEYHEDRVRPFHMLKPKFFIDGDEWCCLYGDNLQDGVAGFGKSPSDASYDFDRRFHEKINVTTHTSAEIKG